MHCKVCQGPASGACRRCGGFYCAKHGGIARGGPICGQCFEKGRPWLVGSVILQAGIGILAVLVASRDRNGRLALLAIVPFGVAAAQYLYLATRRNPWADRTRDE